MKIQVKKCLYKDQFIQILADLALKPRSNNKFVIDCVCFR